MKDCLTWIIVDVLAAVRCLDDLLVAWAHLTQPSRLTVRRRVELEFPRPWAQTVRGRLGGVRRVHGP